MKMRYIWSVIITAAALTSCVSNGDKTIHNDPALDYCVAQVRRTLGQLGEGQAYPVYIPAGTDSWKTTGFEGWTSGFWPGILWYAWEYSGDDELKKYAEYYTGQLKPLAADVPYDHDLGFQLFCSYGNGYRLTGDDAYRRVILDAANRLAELFNPRVGTILSWPWEWASRNGWPHNTIIDNMMNLELLFWASRNGGGSELYDIAVSHADVTMRNHFRPDGSSYHVAVYDDKSGEFIEGVTFQGYSDSSTWSRGQAWAVYGYTFVYRETREKRFLDFACLTADYYLGRLPEDMVPYWDFDAPDIPDAPRDASAAAIAASALLELSSLVTDNAKSAEYYAAAGKMLASLGSGSYRSGELNPSFLLHSTGFLPAGSQVDASIIYADYYYLEALLRMDKYKK